MPNINSSVISSPYSLYPNVIFFISKWFCFFDIENILTLMGNITFSYNTSQNKMSQKCEKKKLCLPV